MCMILLVGNWQMDAKAYPKLSIIPECTTKPIDRQL